MRSQNKVFLQFISGILMAVLSAVLLVLSFSPFNFSFLIFVALVPMVVSQYHIMPEKFSSLSPAIGIGGFLFGYLGGLFVHFGAEAWYMKGLPLIIAVLTYFTNKTSRVFHEKTNFKYFILDGTSSWVGIEFIRMFIPAFGTWAFISYAFYNQPWFIQPVSIFGIFSVSLLVVLINYTLSLLLVALITKRINTDLKFVKKWILVAALLLFLWTGLSIVMFNAPLNSEAKANSGTQNTQTTNKIKVAAIQPNPFEIVPLYDLWDGNFTSNEVEYFKTETRKRLFEMTRLAAKEGAKIIVWPEGSFDFDPKVKNTQFNTLIFKNLAKETDAYLIIPYVISSPDGNRNEVTVLSPDGEFLGVFGKDHPVVFAGETSLTRGTYPVYDTPFGTLGTIICYDLDFLDTARKVSARGAQIILAPSGDWPEIAYKHYTHAIFRAVENRVSLVKADWAYGSVIIDPYGRILEKSANPEGEMKILIHEVPLGIGKTKTIVFKDLIGFLSFAGMIIISVFQSIKFKKILKNSQN